MKIFDLMKLGHAHIYVHKRQSFLTVLSAGVLFGALLGVAFLFEGLEKLFIRSSESLSETSSVYVVSSSCTSTDVCQFGDAMNALARSKSEPYGGTIVGSLDTYRPDGSDYKFTVVDQEYVEGVLSLDFGKYESGTLFKIISLDEAERILNQSAPTTPVETVEPEVPESNDLASFEAGVDLSTTVAATDNFNTAYTAKNYSSTEISELESKLIGRELVDTYETTTVIGFADENPELPITETQTREIRYVVAGIIGSSNTRLTIAENYDEVRILDFFLSRIDSKVIQPELFVARKGDTKEALMAAFNTSSSPTSIPIIKFNNLDSAYAYYKNENCKLERNLSVCSSYTVSELIGNRLETKNALDTLYIFLNYAGGALLLVAVAISVFTFVRLIGENARSIALYRALGASSGDILLIHLFYLLELCLLTAVFAIVLGADFAVVISVRNSSALSSILTSIYARPISPGLLIGFGKAIWVIILAIFMTAPLCSLLTLDQLSPKNISKKIKN